MTNMPQHTHPQVLLLTLASLERRLSKLEAPDKSLLKRLTDNAGAVALFLGLVLTFASLYDVFITKPAADRVEALGKFNQAVNGAAQVRQEMLELQLQTTNPMLQMTVASLATPRALNNISTARALLPELRDEDIGIPQLIVLISESFTTGDIESAGDFVRRAVGKQNVTPYLRSEALRYQGKYLFLIGKAKEARESFKASIDLLESVPGSAAQRAHLRADLVGIEFTFGDCTQVAQLIQDLITLLNAPGVSVDARRQIGATLHNQLQQTSNARCPIPEIAAQLL
jgi:hypothetical protein